MKKVENVFIKNLRYLCLVGVIALGLLTVVATGGGGGGESDEYTYQQGTTNDSGQIAFDVESDSFVVQVKDETGNPLQGVDVHLFEFGSLDVLMVFSEDSSGDHISDISFVDKTTKKELSGLQALGFQDEMIDLSVYLPRWYEAVSFKEGFIAEGSHLDNICDELGNVLRPSYVCEDEVTLAELAEVYESREFFNTTTGLLYELGTSVAPDGWLIDTVAKRDPGEWMATAARIQEALVELFGGDPQDVCFKICRETKTGILVHRLTECQEEPYNSCPTSSITSPSDGSTYTQGDTISFSGSGEDAEDGTLTGSSLVWTSSSNGEIGTGTSFTRSDLSVGTHTITLTATDSEGVTGSDSVSITISSEAYVETFPIPDTIQPYLEGIEHDGTYLWASVNRLAPEVRVYEVNPSDGTILRSYLQNHYNPASSNVIGLAYDSANNLIYNHVYPYGPIYAVDASTLVEVSGSSISAPASWIHDITFDTVHQVLWAVKDNGTIYKIDPSDGSVLGSFTSPGNVGITWDGNYLWLAGGGYLYQVDSDQALADGNCNNSILQEFYMPDLVVPVGRLAWDGSFLWTGSSAEGLFYKIDVGNLP